MQGSGSGRPNSRFSVGRRGLHRLLRDIPRQILRSAPYHQNRHFLLFWRPTVVVVIGFSVLRVQPCPGRSLVSGGYSKRPMIGSGVRPPDDFRHAESIRGRIQTTHRNWTRGSSAGTAYTSSVAPTAIAALSALGRCWGVSADAWRSPSRYRSTTACLPSDDRCRINWGKQKRWVDSTPSWTGSSAA